MCRLPNALKSPAAKNLSGLILSFIGGFTFSGTALAGASSFADISLAGTLDLPFAAAALAGAIIRGVTTDSVGRSIVKTAAMSFIIIAKLFTGGNNSPTRNAVITTISVILSGISVSALI